MLWSVLWETEGSRLYKSWDKTINTQTDLSECELHSDSYMLQASWDIYLYHLNGEALYSGHWLVLWDLCSLSCEMRQDVSSQSPSRRNSLTEEGLPTAMFYNDEVSVLIFHLKKKFFEGGNRSRLFTPSPFSPKIKKINAYPLEQHSLGWNMDLKNTLRNQYVSISWIGTISVKRKKADQ